VADRDRVVVAADEDFADDESQDALLLVEGQLVQAIVEAAEESCGVSEPLIERATVSTQGLGRLAPVVGV